MTSCAHLPLLTRHNIQSGIDNEEVLLKGFVKGVGEALGELSEPFISESIFTEAFADIIAREGVTREGKRLYTDETPLGDKVDIIGPLGNMWFYYTQEYPILIGGGVGIAPILNLHNHLLNKESIINK